MFRHYLLSLLILILAFEVGMTALLYVNKAMLTEQERTSLETAVEQPKTFDSCDNEDHLELLIYYDGIPGYTLGSRMLAITNRGNKPVYYDRGDVSVKDNPMHIVYPSQIAQNGNVSEEVKLTNGEARSFPLSDGPFDVVFPYRSGDARSFRSFSAHFSGGWVPDGCY